MSEFRLAFHGRKRQRSSTTQLHNADRIVCCVRVRAFRVAHARATDNRSFQGRRRVMKTRFPIFSRRRDVRVSSRVSWTQKTIALSAAFAFVPFGWHTLAQQQSLLSTMQIRIVCCVRVRAFWVAHARATDMLWYCHGNCLLSLSLHRDSRDSRLARFSQGMPTASSPSPLTEIPEILVSLGFRKECHDLSTPPLHSPSQRFQSFLSRSVSARDVMIPQRTPRG